MLRGVGKSTNCPCTMRGTGSRSSSHLPAEVVGRKVDSWLAMCGSSADSDLCVGQERVGRHLEVARRRPLADAPRRVVVRPVAGAEPAAEVAPGVAQALAFGDAAQVRADAHQDEPVLLAGLGAVLVGGAGGVGQVVVAGGLVP